MTQWTRTIGRQVTNSLPAWVSAISTSNTLYKIAGNPTTDMSGQIIWPSGSQPPHWGGDYLQHAGFGAAVYVADGGAYGTMVYCGTGEDVFNTHLTSLPLSNATVTWQVYQQPYYALTQAEAQTQDGDWYYNPSAEDSFTASRPNAAMNVPPGVYSLSSWDKTFPVTLAGKGWVQWRKVKQTLGKNQPIRLRYNTPTFVPASMTGTGAGAIIAFDDNFAGPLRGSNGMPENISNYYNSGAAYNPGDYAQDLMPNGDLALRFRAMNTSTKVWTTLAPLHRPVQAGSDITRGHAFVDTVAKRVYYAMAGKSLYLDLSGGLAGATVSAPVSMTLNPSNGTFSFDVNSGAGPCEGHPQGRKLVFVKWGLYGADPSDSTKLLLLDHDATAMFILDFAAVGFNMLPSPGQMLDFGFGYNPAAGSNGTLYLTYRKRFTTEYYLAKFPLPNDPTNVANYTGSFAPSRTLLPAAGGATLETAGYGNPFGDSRCYVPSLNVILWPHQTQVFAFKPA